VIILIYITGDTHGGIDIQKLASDKFLEGNNLTKDDYLIISGDFGFIWTMDSKDIFWLKWFDKKKFTTLFIDGNHENFDLLNKFPEENWNGGKIHRINESVIHLMRGQVFSINGKKIFTFGGGESIDKMFREEGVSWWREEMPLAFEYEEGIKNLEMNNWDVDYVVTHTCTSRNLNKINELYSTFKEVNELNDYFDLVEDKLNFKHWYFGHFHQDFNIDNKHTCLYNNLIQII
jgi:hypothetical protein